MKKTVILILLVLFYCSYAHAATYYVKTSGNDSNTGYSNAYAWATLNKVNLARLQSGDTVLFKRGDTWRGHLSLRSGDSGKYITYAAYGNGNAPKILGSVNAKDASKWSNPKGHIWEYENGSFSTDVGNLIFNDERGVGVKKWTEADLTSQGDFWYDKANKKIKMYSASNPATYYSNIECALTNHVISIGVHHHCIIQDLDLRYGAAHGIVGTNCYNIIIQDCSISYIGGGDQYQDGVRQVRYGNGIEFWDSAHDTIVRRCRIDNIYDAGVTTQGATPNNIKSNQNFYDNIISNCEYSFEFWNRDSTSKCNNIFFENNTCVKAGGGWGHSQRPNKMGVHFMFYTSTASLTDVFVRNNIAYLATEYSFYFSNSKNVANIALNKNLYYSDTGLLGIVLNPTTKYNFSQLYRWNTDYKQDMDSISGRDPLLNSDYSLKKGSPCINSGTNLANAVYDYNRLYRAGTYDIGAYEYGAIGRASINSNWRP